MYNNNVGAVGHLKRVQTDWCFRYFPDSKWKLDLNISRLSNIWCVLFWSCWLPGLPLRQEVMQALVFCWGGPIVSPQGLMRSCDYWWRMNYLPLNMIYFSCWNWTRKANITSFIFNQNRATVVQSKVPSVQSNNRPVKASAFPGLWILMQNFNWKLNYIVYFDIK